MLGQLSPAHGDLAAPPIPQAEGRRLLLGAIAGLGREPASSFLELRFRRPGEPMRQSFIACRDLDTASARAAVLAQEHDCYVAAAPRARRFGGADAVERVWCLWVDLDSPEAAEALEGFAPAPSMVIATGTPGHCHAWWPLNAPLRPDHARAALRRLAHALGGDMSAAEPARILRPAGTLNHKHDPPAPVECVSLELDSYHAREVVGALPDPPAPVAQLAPARPRAAAPRGSDPLRELEAEFYVRALTGREPDRDGKVRCPLHAGGQEATPSMHLYGTGWTCFGSCEPLRSGRKHLGGDVYVLGGLLYGLDWRDREQFLELRRRLAAELLHHVREAAA